MGVRGRGIICLVVLAISLRARSQPRSFLDEMYEFRAQFKTQANETLRSRLTSVLDLLFLKASGANLTASGRSLKEVEMLANSAESIEFELQKLIGKRQAVLDSSLLIVIESRLDGHWGNLERLRGLFDQDSYAAHNGLDRFEGAVTSPFVLSLLDELDEEDSVKLEEIIQHTRQSLKRSRDIADESTEILLQTMERHKRMAERLQAVKEALVRTEQVGAPMKVARAPSAEEDAEVTAEL
mmetsp:Transcript_56510/g.104637  ORF Transcript_56510/g.104637 Transcript_56510/m.104637 type:complete len:240 (-) Transcript_56510:30-749(-)